MYQNTRNVKWSLKVEGKTVGQIKNQNQRYSYILRGFAKMIYCYANLHLATFAFFIIIIREYSEVSSNKMAFPKP